MLTKKQIEEIRVHLERAQNPIFFYDNDADGLCSFIILRRLLGRGYGVAVRSYPELNESYARKAEQLGADYVFVLDKPVMEKGFVEEINKMGLPLVWIDHHDEADEFSGNYDNFFAYNPTKNKGKNKSNEPVSYLAYKIADKKEDIWISVMGCIADCYLPDFVDEFSERYPDYWGKDITHPFGALYGTEIGNIAFALGFGLKDSTTHIVQLQKFLCGVNGPEDVFSETPKNKIFRNRYLNVKKKFDEILKKSEEIDNVIWLEYAGEISMSSDISNKLSYNYPDKYICVAFKKGGVVNCSLRGENVKDVLLDILKDFENSSGGGHPNAVGCQIQYDDLDRFKQYLIEKTK